MKTVIIVIRFQKEHFYDFRVYIDQKKYVLDSNNINLSINDDFTKFYRHSMIHITQTSYISKYLIDKLFNSVNKQLLAMCKLFQFLNIFPLKLFKI